MIKDFLSERRAMVDRQLRPRDIRDVRVLDAMLKVPRDMFVPEGERSQSYYDGPLPIGQGQTISQPYIVAYMTDILCLTGVESVLEIGTGSGYQSAILAEVAGHVYTVEVIADLSAQAKTILSEKMHYTNISFKIGNGRQGWPEFAPFDRIIITAAAREFPEKLFAQLKVGGIALAPIGSFYQQLIRYTRTATGIEAEPLIAVSFVPCV